MRYYTLNSNNEPQGPFSMEEISAFLKEGTLSSISLICREGGKEWVPLSIVNHENTLKTTIAKGSNRQTNLLYGACGVVLGILISALMLFLFIHYALDTPKHNSGKDSKKWFVVRDAADAPKGAWYGNLCEKGYTYGGTSTIVDFGESVNLAQDDIIEGMFVQTESNGQQNKHPFRIFTVTNGYKLIDRSTLKK